MEAKSRVRRYQGSGGPEQVASPEIVDKWHHLCISYSTDLSISPSNIFSEEQAQMLSAPDNTWILANSQLFSLKLIDVAGLNFLIGKRTQELERRESISVVLSSTGASIF